jgi:hypothetical protein
MDITLVFASLNFGDSFIKQTMKIAGASLLVAVKEGGKIEEIKIDISLYITTSSLLALQSMSPHERQKITQAVKRDRKLSRDVDRIVHKLIRHRGGEKQNE